MYEYQFDVTRVIDGDTLEGMVDLGFDVHLKQRLRLAGLNAPEHNTIDGQKAITFVNDWLKSHIGPYVIKTIKDRREKYGRMLAVVYWHDSAVLNDDLISGGYAKPWDGKGERP